MLNLSKNGRYFKEQTTKTESVKQLGLTHDEVQRLILHAGVIMGWPVGGVPGSPETMIAESSREKVTLRRRKVKVLM